ncbi:MAG: hypothetical protein AAFP19_00080 [Bacteroidota bacterium]
MKDEFWAKISADIETQYGKGHPSNWKIGSIRAFLVDMEDKLYDICQDDFKKAKLCGVPFVKGKYFVAEWKAIDTVTFRRIFKYQTSRGQASTKHQFAIYLGYESYEDYVNKRDITLDRPSSSPPAEPSENKSPKYFLYLFAALITLLPITYGLLTSLDQHPISLDMDQQENLSAFRLVGTERQRDASAEGSDSSSIEPMEGQQKIVPSSPLIRAKESTTSDTSTDKASSEEEENPAPNNPPPKPSLTGEKASPDYWVSLRVLDTEDNQPIPGVRVGIAQLVKQTDSLGLVHLTPSDMEQVKKVYDMLAPIQYTKQGYLTVRGQLNLSQRGTDIISLKKNKDESTND